MELASLTDVQIENVFKPIYKKADEYMFKILLVHVGISFFLALFYDTWLLAVSVSTLSLVAWFGVKAILPEGNAHRYVASLFLGIYVGLFIYQMHGMFEMHFFAFVSAAILVIYQNWKLQIPLLLFIVVHHASFAYAQFSGMQEVYFTQLQYMDLQTFIFHAVLFATVVAVCGYWGYSFRRNTITEAQQKETLSLANKKIAQDNVILNKARVLLKAKNQQLNKSNEELESFNDELMKTTRKQMEINEKLANLKLGD
ncbi:hypothetical protein N7E81_15310 [Reichenbachiella carrageenanivorans]|uniref:Methyl-accepting chemotaxis protein n=1 Tax=Reichenbachiella carrageenanivorans TaxID=2979869 RepID=A0ABY6CXT9_9BACT|nr:hypothetical protein [Reichenbachiella carrageenanivorans]UXX78727.1 hypothetical protein N7E81_15310 [Reichenbachiella carrageenanivorans]